MELSDNFLITKIVGIVDVDLIVTFGNFNNDRYGYFIYIYFIIDLY